MKFNVLHVSMKKKVLYSGLQRIGGEEKLFEEEVGQEFTNWERYYDRRQSAILEGNPHLFNNRDRSNEFKYYKDAFGILPKHSVLDYGCATIGVGQHFIRHLEPGCYVGMDVSERAIAIAREFVSTSDLKHRDPKLVLIQNGEMAEEFEGCFDFMIAISVFTHSPPAIVFKILKYARSVLKPGGILVASSGIVEDNIYFQGLHNFYYPKQFYEFLSERLGLDLEIKPDPLSGAKDPRQLGDSMNVIIKKPL